MREENLKPGVLFTFSEKWVDFYGFSGPALLLRRGDLVEGPTLILYDGSVQSWTAELTVESLCGEILSTC